jgi:hypothetical protein
MFRSSKRVSAGPAGQQEIGVGLEDPAEARMRADEMGKRLGDAGARKRLVEGPDAPATEAARDEGKMRVHLQEARAAEEKRPHEVRKATGPGRQDQARVKVEMARARRKAAQAERRKRRKERDKRRRKRKQAQRTYRALTLVERFNMPLAVVLGLIMTGHGFEALFTYSILHDVTTFTQGVAKATAAVLVGTLALVSFAAGGGLGVSLDGAPRRAVRVVFALLGFLLAAAVATFVVLAMLARHQAFEAFNGGGNLVVDPMFLAPLVVASVTASTSLSALYTLGGKGRGVRKDISDLGAEIAADDRVIGKLDAEIRRARDDEEQALLSLAQARIDTDEAVAMLDSLDAEHDARIAVERVLSDYLPRRVRTAYHLARARLDGARGQSAPRTGGVVGPTRVSIPKRPAAAVGAGTSLGIVAAGAGVAPLLSIGIGALTVVIAIAASIPVRTGVLTSGLVGLAGQLVSDDVLTPVVALGVSILAGVGAYLLAEIPRSAWPRIARGAGAVSAVLVAAAGAGLLGLGGRPEDQIGVALLVGLAVAMAIAGIREPRALWAAATLGVGLTLAGLGVPRAMAVGLALLAGVLAARVLARSPRTARPGPPPAFVPASPNGSGPVDHIKEAA